MEAFDLDAARAARAEMRGDPPCFLFGGQKFTLPVECPAEFAYMLDDSKEALRFLLGDQFDEFWAHRPSKEDILELVRCVGKTAGMTVGESSASGGSSPKGSSPSRPTSPATTRRTSAKRASGRPG